jgi:hypothetical protein
VLYEAQERDCVAHGAEVNPAAWHLAALASYGGLPQSERGYILARLMSVAQALGLQTFSNSCEMRNIRS